MTTVAERMSRQLLATGPDATVFDDTSVDVLTGSAGHDWFFANLEGIGVQDKIADLGEEITREYAGRDLLLVGVLKGAFVFMADLSRHVRLPLEFDFMAVSSYGAATQTSGVVRILKDLDHEIQGRHVLLVEDIVDSGLTLSYLMKNLRTRKPASLEVCALLQKTGVQQVPLDIRYRAFEIPPVFVVGYGLDYGERFRNLPFVGTLRPEVYRDAVS